MKFGCVGEHLGHSFSADIHACFAPYAYELCEVPRDAFDAFMKARAFCGINVTIPYKQAVLPYLSEISENARKIGAVNTVVNRDGRLYGYNTDYAGMKALLAYAGIDLRGKKVLICGTGGTSLTALAVATDGGAGTVLRAGRTGRDGTLTYADVYRAHSDTEILINTTPCGMYPNIEGTAVDLGKLPALEGVIDAVYNPLRSELVMKAREKGIRASGGLYMLVAQAVFAGEKFTDCRYGEQVIGDVYKTVLKAKENIVLTGMPGSGKSTVGHMLAEKLGRPFLDTDALVESKAGESIQSLFKTHGEAYFRALEADAVREAAKTSGAVLATGGGVVLRPENLRRLKQNGRIYFLDRPPELLLPTESRPLASDLQAIKARYAERYRLYCDSADEIITNGGGAEEAVTKILK